MKGTGCCGVLLLSYLCIVGLCEDDEGFLVRVYSHGIGEFRSEVVENELLNKIEHWVLNLELKGSIQFD